MKRDGDGPETIAKSGERNDNKPFSHSTNIQTMPQEETFDYARVPYDYTHCFNHDCPRAAECLRHLAGQHIPPSVRTVRCVSPSAWPAGDGACDSYQVAHKVTLAWGLSRLTQGVPYPQDKAIQRAVRQLWPHSSYARIRHLERPIQPDMQRKIESIFALYAPGARPTYESLTETYDFGL